MLTNLKLKKGMSILDIGCGKSPIQFLLSDLGAKVFAIDPNENVAWHGIDRKLAKRFCSKIEYRKEGAESISYDNDFFDRVICISVLEHCRANKEENGKFLPLSDADHELQREMVNEMIRVLKPGGFCIIIVDFFFPRDNPPLEYNIDGNNLMKVDETELIGNRINEFVPGELGFDYINLIKNHDIDINCSLQTSIGFIFLKKKKIYG